MQALMLAAGMGQRMGKYTQTCTKCMIKVGGQTLLERAIAALREAGITKFIIVVGWEGEKLIKYIKDNIFGIDFKFVYNHDYAITNNIYSLYLAKDLLTQDDTILLESDLVYEKSLLRKIVDFPEKDLVAVSKYEHWMDGTMVALDPDGMIHEFIDKQHFSFENIDSYYKTVNIYKFSRNFLNRKFVPFLGAYITAYGNEQYYEMVLKVIVKLPNTKLKAFVLGDVLWYEIDDIQDLNIAQTIFATNSRKVHAYEKHYGGYWRFSHIKDFCYLVNPFFPPPKMLEQIKHFCEPLITQYPSGLNIQSLLAGKLFQIDQQYLVVGNGAAELISTLGRIIHGKLALSIPAFNEYIRCFNNCEIIPLVSSKNHFQLNKNNILQIIGTVQTLIIVNPDNPSGSFLTYNELIEILTECKKHHVRCIVDESFIDFAQKDVRYTLLNNHLLEFYPELIIIKSISKTYGIPGLRLGVMATADKALIQSVKDNLPIWNVNSLAEYFFQIISLYSNEYENACNEIAFQRTAQEKRLGNVSYIRVYPSQANFIMCQVRAPRCSNGIATELLNTYGLMIKDLSEKKGFDNKQYVRIAVKSEAENVYIYDSLKALE